MIAQGYAFSLSFLSNETEPVGFAAMTVFPKPIFEPSDFDLEYLQTMANLFHESLKKSGLMATTFNLSEKEIASLRLMSTGKTAFDIASLSDVTVRTIELRLASARKKLHAKTTTEAVYKAASYGILGRGKTNLAET